MLGGEENVAMNKHYISRECRTEYSWPLHAQNLELKELSHGILSYFGRIQNYL